MYSIQVMIENLKFFVTVHVVRVYSMPPQCCATSKYYACSMLRGVIKETLEGIVHPHQTVLNEHCELRRMPCASRISNETIEGFTRTQVRSADFQNCDKIFSVGRFWKGSVVYRKQEIFYSRP